MAALVEGRKYGLSSLQSASAGKTLVHMKLTDSAYRAIEEFIRIKDVTERRPLIKFESNRGVFKIPIKKSSDNPEGLQNFQFTVAAIQGDPNGSFDCLKQASQNRGTELESLGSMIHKIVVRATDDSYQKTRERMTIAEEESKKSCAKEIKPGGPNIGRRVKKTVDRSVIEDRLKASSTNNSPSGSYSSSPSVMTGSTTAGAVKQLPQVPRTGFQSASHNKSGSSSPHSHSTGIGATSKDGATAHRQNPRLHKPPPNPTVFNLPIRDRIIHLLVLRPYKKPELIIRLQRDGMRDKDKASLSAILKEVGVLQKDNSYTLSKSLYSQVRSNWPGYQDIDRTLLKRVLAKNEMNPSTASSPALSPAHSNTSSQGSSPGGSHKRPTSTTDEEVPSKRQRVAHDRRDHNSSSQAKKDSPASSTSESPKVTTTTPDVNPEVKVAPQVIKEKKHEKYSNHHVDKQSSHKENINSNNTNQQTTKLPASSTSEIPDYVLKYPSISDCDQRARYKADFNAEYEEYRALHADVAKVLRKFKELEAEIRRKKEGTQDYENTKNEILTQYKKVKQNTAFTEQRQRCDYLHKKLAHIKHCITDYDGAQHSMS